MTARIIQNVSRKILVVGPIFGKIDKLSRVKTLINNYEYIVFNGNLYYPFMNLELLETCIKFVDELLLTDKIVYNLGNYDLMLMEGLLVPVPDSIADWYVKHPNIVTLEFNNKSRIVVTSGGVTPKMNKDNLLDNLETSFVDKIDGTIWHKTYKGNLGYIISNNPLTMEPPRFYNYSAQIGNEPKSDAVYAQEADQFGLKETISL